MKKNLANKYLSIGEVSKIMKVSHTSLRYYDEIGILKPAYTNQDTGYRYYAKNQMPVLSMIMLAIDLDIPLKEFEKYLENGSDVSLEEFVIYAKQQVNNSIKKLERDLYFLKSTEKHFLENNINFNRLNQNEYIKTIDERCLLTLPCSYVNSFDAFDFADYWEKTTELYSLISKFELSLTVEQGLLYYKKDDDINAKYFVEIKKTKKKSIEHAEVVHLPKGEYLCSFYSHVNVEESNEKYLQHPSFQNGKILIVSDVLEKDINTKNIHLEVQILE